MPRAKKLVRISSGVYRDGHSLRAVVNGASGRQEKRFPFDTPLSEIKRWRNETKVRLDAAARRRPVTRGTLGEDVRTYLSQIKSLISWKSRRSELDAWLSYLGPDTPRRKITEQTVRAAVQQWQQEDYAVRTCEHRVAALRHLYRTLDGPDLPTPCDRITFTLPDTQPVYVPAETILKVAAALTDPATRARFMVLTTTGVRPAELMRALPSDVSLEERLWIVRTAKGGFRPAMRLNADMVAAWQAFAAAKAWGPYDTSAHALKLYAAGWPKGVRPYNARATFGMELSKRGADLADIQQILGHRNVQTTRAYYVPREDSRISAALKSVEGRLQWPVLAPDVGTAKHRRKVR